VVGHEEVRPDDGVIGGFISELKNYSPS
jgi:hypothetical protein